MQNITFLKALFFLSIVFLVVHCSESEYQVLPEDSVNQGQKVLAESIAVNILYSMQSGEFKALGEEATIKMQEGLTPDKQKIAYSQIKNLFGDYQSLSYHETCVPKTGAKINVYRFKGKFSKDIPAEIRVVVDNQNKLSGFWIKEWNDQMQ